jgi:hypothetical protein
VTRVAKKGETVARLEGNERGNTSMITRAVL